ncbi:MAG: hypothetical protein JNK87_36690 [Bryobacterales bacterium]|nr:hypothetical protein [Bryobacterales bacterium]
MLFRAFLVSLLALLPALAQTLPSLSVTPANLSFSFTIGTTTLPAAQTLAIKRSGSGTALDFTASVNPPAPWLIVTPTTGKTGTSISVRVNPTSLAAGSYVTVLQIDAVGSSGPITAGVELIIRNPPPTMTATPASLSYTWQTDAASQPAAQTVTLSTSGEPYSFSVAVAATGGSWLAATPAVGVVLSGSAVPVAVSVDTTGLSPGTYTGRITLTSLTASNKTLTVTVTLTVTPGTAVISSIWPNAAPIGSNDLTITVRGSHLFKASVIKANSTDLTATWISTGVMLATIPKALLTAQAALQVTVLNSPQPASNALTFTVTPPGPQVQTVVNAASFVTDLPKPVLAPGEIITIFGSGMGPTTGIQASPSSNAFPTTLGTPAGMVEFEINSAWVAAPIIFLQANQINCQVPFTLPVGTDLKMRVTYNALTSTNFLFDGAAASPGIFTVDSSGRGQAAALNYDATKLAYSLNSAANPASKGGVLIFYLTGAGAISPAPSPEGALSGTSPLPTLSSVPSVTIGGDAASVLSATAVPGALGGLVQLNVTVPTSVSAGKDLAVVITIASRSTPATATVSVK